MIDLNFINALKNLMSKKEKHRVKYIPSKFDDCIFNYGIGIKLNKYIQ